MYELEWEAWGERDDLNGQHGLLGFEDEQHVSFTQACTRFIYLRDQYPYVRELTLSHVVPRA